MFYEWVIWQLQTYQGLLKSNSWTRDIIFEWSNKVLERTLYASDNNRQIKD